MEKIIVNVASYNRINSLIKTINSIINQCDEINICLNDYKGEIPTLFKHSKINIFYTDNSKGDAFKFLKLSESKGYFLTIDDDIIYPNNYVDYMVKKCKEYNNERVITLHGRNFSSFPIKSYYNSPSSVFTFNGYVGKDTPVQFGGTGVMCFHTDLINLKLEYFQTANMADVWIGKYCMENKIKIMCVKHDKNYLKYIDQPITIYGQESKKDSIQTNLINSIKIKNPQLSVIIPTFNNVEYIDECLESVVKSSKGYDIEILVGIDGCKKTYEYIKNKIYPSIVTFFYFDKNKGPYLIKNTLSAISKSDTLLFFDSDDVMLTNMIQTIIGGKQKYTMIKPKYKNFGNKNYVGREIGFGEGVFSIHKKIFLSMNGFEPWICAADSDFMGRFYKRKDKNTLHTIDVMFKRRIHNTGLTSRPETGMSSPLRAKYARISKQKKGDGNPSKFNIEKFNRLDLNSFEINLNENVEIIENVDIKNIEILNLRKEIIKKINNKTKTENKKIEVEKRVIEVNYEKINNLFKNRVIPKNAPKMNNSNTPKKLPTNNDMVKVLLPNKKTRRNGDPIITIGGKNIK